VKPLVLIRHASAGDREMWSGDDRERPLDERGRRQAEGLVSALEPYDIEHVLSSPARRCVQTVEPLASHLSVEIEKRPELMEGASREEALALVDELRGSAAALCTHGDVVFELLGDGLKKGAAAVLRPDDNDLRRVTKIKRQA
jgi:phosphohistidine phosphatase SixA